MLTDREPAFTTWWTITDKGDPLARRLVDGELPGLGNLLHYSRQTVGSRQFTRNGQNLVFITRDGRAVWVTFRPTPGKAVRPDGLDAWECTLFRNEGPYRSSDLIREAVDLSCALWGPIPPDGFITFIRADCVLTGQSAGGVVGYCYRRAGWRHVGSARDGKPRFKAPQPPYICDWRLWEWAGDRGGKLRRELTAK